MSPGLAIAADGALVVAVLSAVALLLFLVASWTGRWPAWVAGYVVVALALFAAFFFRDPPRSGERGPLVYVSPADGEVVGVERVFEEEYLNGEALRVSVFLSLFDVHVQRSPVDGVVDYVSYRPGRFAPAWDEAATSENERTTIGINTGQTRVMVRQIAGLVARRIVTYVGEGELVDQGERIGLIRFGSRVEAYLPPGARAAVRVGDRVRAGTTVLAHAPVPATNAPVEGTR